MPRKAKELSALEVNRLKCPGNHAVGGVAGLYLCVNDAGARSWILRTVIGGKRRHMGLGGFPDVTYAQAKEKARSARELVLRGTDPIAERRVQAQLLRVQQAPTLTFKEAAEGYLTAHGDTWRNSKHRAQWFSTLQTYAYPHMGTLPVREVNREHVLAALQPIWMAKNETAARLRGRIETILDWATAKQHRSGENPARWKGYLDMLLAAPSRIKKVQHHRAVAIDELATFMAMLRAKEGVAASALEFTILCASRSGEVRGANWSEIDLKKAVWTIPAERMKAGKQHRVPLSGAAVAVLTRQRRFGDSDLVFASSRGGMLSDMSMTAVMRRMEVNAVPHGFRSTFRDWARERTDFARDLAEDALAHVLENKVEAAYRRGDALDKRRIMMESWADFCAANPDAQAASSVS